MKDYTNFAKDILKYHDFLSGGMITEDAFLGNVKLDLEIAYQDGYDDCNEKLKKCVEALQDAEECLQNANENILHYFENECCPTKEEVNAVHNGFISARNVLKEIGHDSGNS